MIGFIQGCYIIVDIAFISVIVTFILRIFLLVILPLFGYFPMLCLLYIIIRYALLLYC